MSGHVLVARTGNLIPQADQHWAARGQAAAPDMARALRDFFLDPEATARPSTQAAMRAALLKAGVSEAELDGGGG